jgi:hypothetical protein
MDIDPTHTSAVQAAIPNERDYISVRHRCGTAQLFVGCEEFLASTDVSDEKFSVD